MVNEANEFEVDELLHTGLQKSPVSDSLTFSLSELFLNVFAKVHQLFSIDCASVVLYDHSGLSIQRGYLSERDLNGKISCLETISNPVALSLLTKEISEFQFPVLKSRSDWIADFGENHCLPNHPTDYHFHCYIPLESEGKVVGTFELHNHKRELSADGLTFCCTISDFLAGFLKNMPNQAVHSKTAPGATTHYQTLSPKYLQQFISLNESLSTLELEDDFNTVLEEFFAVNCNVGFITWNFMHPETEVFISTPQIMTIDEIQKIDIKPEHLRRLKMYNDKPLLYLPLTIPHKNLYFLLALEACNDEEQKIKEFDHTFLFFLAQAVHQFVLRSQLQRSKAEVDKLTQNDCYLESTSLYPEQTIPDYPDIIGRSAEMKVVFDLLGKVSFSETTVLILGETGTGKELIANAIHELSSRKDQTMIKINCAAIPPNLIESELFGHEKGSFTGATDKRIGKFELAHGGTLFLDEIGELPLDLQVKLLRILQEKQFERIGGKTTIFTDVRVISATNRNLAEEVEKGLFRRDLFYRLNVFPISIPALRNRKTDIPSLAIFFLKKYAEKSKKHFAGFSKKAISEMKMYNWPGNVRELEHMIERQVVLNAGPIIKSVDIPKEDTHVLTARLTGTVVKTIDENERDHIFAILALCNGKISGPNGAAKLLGVPATTLNSKIKRLGLSKKHSF